MYFPKYWTRVTVQGANREGDWTQVEAWGWSDIGEEDAKLRATVRGEALIAKLPCDRNRQRTYYEDRPCREPVLQDLSRGEMRAVITRNSLGCEVLNTESMAFADLDYQPPRTSFFALLFGSGRKKALEHRKAWEEQALQKLRTWQSANPSWSFRVYRTAGGLRVLVISRTVMAGTDEAKAWLKDMGSDPLYQKLCENQKSFRARLTPKSWRCGLRQPTVRFPWETEKKQQIMEKWISNYQQKSQGFAVCELIETMGAPFPISELKPLIDLHDTRTAVASGLPLA